MTLITDTVVSQHISTLHLAAARARLAAETQTIRHQTPRGSSRLRRPAAAVRRWFDRGQLGSVNNYIVS